MPNQNYSTTVGVYDRIDPEALGTAGDPGREIYRRDHAALENPGRIHVCQVKTYHAGFASYTVHHPILGDRTAAEAGGMSGSLGARTYHCHQPGSLVLCWFPASDAAYGEVLGSAPVQDPHTLAPLLTEGSGVGMAYDAIHRLVADLEREDENLDDRSMDLNFANGRPLDSLGGDSGAVNSLGVGYQLTQASCRLHAGLAEVLVSHLDHTVRMAGDTLAFESPGLQHHHFVDQGEVGTIRHFAPYVWEGLGGTAPGEGIADVQRDKPPQPLESLDEDPARFHPEAFDQAGRFRSLMLEGPLAGLHRILATMPEGPGLADLQVDVDGFVSCRSAKGILLEKSSWIAAPLQKREPWDPEGDRDDQVDYGRPPFNRPDFNWPDPALRGHLASEHNGFRQDIGTKALREHEKDWKTPPEKDVQLTSGSPNNDPLAERFRADLTPSTRVNVDHRREGVAYHVGKSSMLFGDDGSITLQDAYGSSIVMSGGHIELCPRGDLIARPGRRSVTMAPHDVILNAGRNLEAAASTGNVRIKSEKDLSMLGANGGQGGVLIESRSTDIRGEGLDYEQPGDGSLGAGVTIKADQGPFTVWAGQGLIQTVNGPLALEGDNQDVLIAGRNVSASGSSSTSLISGVRPGEDTERASVLRMDRTQYTARAGGMRMRAEGGEFQLLSATGGSARMLIDGRMTANGPLFSPNDEIQPHNPQEMIPSVDDLKDRADDHVGEQLELFTGLVDRFHEQEPALAGRETRDLVAFGFNSSDTYKTSDGFILGATAWQLRYAASGHRESWQQPAVSFHGQDTRPWPGEPVWSSEGLAMVEPESFVYHDPQAGFGLIPDDPADLPVEVVAMDGHYIIDSQK